MTAQATKKVPEVPKYVQCTRLSQNGKLVKGKVYEVVRAEYEEYYVRDGARDVGWFYSSYFQVMPPTYDHLEQRLRLILTTPCAYHP